jgi:hypothetical protein
VGEGKAPGDSAAVLLEVFELGVGLGVAAQDELLSQNVLEENFSDELELVLVDVVVMLLSQREVLGDGSASETFVLDQGRDVDVFVASLSLQLVNVCGGEKITGNLGSDDDLGGNVFEDLFPHFVGAFVGVDGVEVGLGLEVAEDVLAVLGVVFVLFELVESLSLTLLVDVGLDGVLGGVEVVEELGLGVAVAEDPGLLYVLGEVVEDEVSLLVGVEELDQSVDLDFVGGVGYFVFEVEGVKFDVLIPCKVGEMLGDVVLAAGWGTVEENQVGEEGLSGVSVDVVLVLFAVDVADLAELLVEVDGLAGLLVVSSETSFDCLGIVVGSFFLAFGS